MVGRWGIEPDRFRNHLHNFPHMSWDNTKLLIKKVADNRGVLGGPQRAAFLKAPHDENNHRET